MSAHNRPMGGTNDPSWVRDTTRYLQIEHIQHAIRELEEQDCPGARELQVLGVAGALTQVFHRWKLVNFPYDSLAYTTIARKAGWIVPACGSRLSTTVSQERPDLLLVADCQYASAQSVYSIWAETPNGLVIPENRLHPLEEAPEDIDLKRVYQGIGTYLDRQSRS